MSPQDRADVEHHFRLVHEILCRNGLARMQHGWRVWGELRDGRKVQHSFTVQGYVLPPTKLELPSADPPPFSEET